VGSNKDEIVVLSIDEERSCVVAAWRQKDGGA